MRPIAIALTIAAIAGCETPNVDPGAAPRPTGLVHGTVLYVGPRPQCVRDEAGGGPTQIVGETVLLLFRFDNPPPPAGSATGAISLLTVPGSDMFALADCMPDAPTPADRVPIMRSAPFTWPEIALGSGPCGAGGADAGPPPDGGTGDAGAGCPTISYQIRAFYDYDADFNPFFGVRNLATAGDIGGGAFVIASVPLPQPRELRFGHVEDHPDGQVIEGVAVTLGARVNTERPIFEIAPGATALDSSARFPLAGDARAREDALWAASRLRVRAIVDRAMPVHSDPWLAALEAAGIESSLYRLGRPEYGFYVTAVDANGDGMQDPHPILGSAGTPWYTPIVIVRRARTAIEQRLGLPDVLSIGSIRPSIVLGLPTGVPRRTMTSFDAIVPPVAVMITNPELPALCRAPIIPPGNIAELYERGWSDCQELPSGNYDVNVLNGIAGGTVADAMERCVAECTAAGTDEATCTSDCAIVVGAQTDTGWLIDGGQYSSQAWSVPNELGCPDLLYRPGARNQIDRPRPDGALPLCGEPDSLQLATQSRQGAWAIVDAADPDPAGGFDETSTADGHGTMSCQRAPSAVTMMVEDVTYAPPPRPECCPPALDRFCGRPLCPLRDASDTIDGEPLAVLTAPYDYPEAAVPDATGRRTTREIREPGVDYRVEADGSITPLCTPFLMPVECCRIAAMRSGS
jgi:hypothetical protein